MPLLPQKQFPCSLRGHYLTGYWPAPPPLFLNSPVNMDLKQFCSRAMLQCK